jgi:hypothetical protein
MCTPAMGAAGVFTSPCPTTTAGGGNFDGVLFTKDGDPNLFITTTSLGSLAAKQSICMSYWMYTTSGITGKHVPVTIAEPGEVKPTYGLQLTFNAVGGCVGGTNGICLGAFRGENEGSNPALTPVAPASPYLASTILNTWVMLGFCVQGANSFVWLDDGTVWGGPGASVAGSRGTWSPVPAGSSGSIGLYIGGRGNWKSGSTSFTPNSNTQAVDTVEAYFDELRIWTKSGHTTGILTSDHMSSLFVKNVAYDPDFTQLDKLLLHMPFYEGLATAATVIKSATQVVTSTRDSSATNTVSVSLSPISGSDANMGEYGPNGATFNGDVPSNCLPTAWMRDVAAGTPYDVNVTRMAVTNYTTDTTSFFIGDQIKFGPLMPNSQPLNALKFQVLACGGAISLSKTWANWTLPALWTPAPIQTASFYAGACATAAGSKCDYPVVVQWKRQASCTSTDDCLKWPEFNETLTMRRSIQSLRAVCTVAGVTVTYNVSRGMEPTGQWDTCACVLIRSVARCVAVCVR